MSFVPSHRITVAPDAAPTRTVFVLHGILGSKRNWATMARRMARAWPRWRVVTVDLRNHGDSRDAPGPHTLTTTAEDLDALARQIGRPHAVVGHSFGGKVALRYAELYPEGLEQVWVLDSALSRAPVNAANEVVRVIQGLRTIALPLPSRQALVPVMGALGFSDGLVAWMTTNLRRADDGYRWTFDLTAVEDMMASYFTEDLWPVVEDAPCELHLLRAERSDRLDPEQEARIAALGPKVQLHVLADSGHWVHADNPEGLLAILGTGFAIAD